MLTRRGALHFVCAAAFAPAAFAQESGDRPTATIPAGPEPRLVELEPGERLPDSERAIDPATGMQRGYAVLSEEERALGFVRPVRDGYTHNVCGQTTYMSRDIAETFARNPSFYSSTFCSHCRVHRPLTEFVWVGTNETVGS